MAKMKKIKFPNETTPRDIFDAGAVRYDESIVLTESQKTQARTNIGAAQLDENGKVPSSQLPSSLGAESTWGDITGTLSNQTDLQSALNAKQKSIYQQSSEPVGAVNGDLWIDTAESSGEVEEGGGDVSHTHDDIYYTETEIDTLLSGKSNTSHNHDTAYAALSHNHDARYYTESEMDILLATKVSDAPSNNKYYTRHNGAWSEAQGGGTWGSITGTLSSQTDLQAVLTAKADVAHFTAPTATPTQVLAALTAGKSFDVSYTHNTYGTLTFNGFISIPTMNVIGANMAIWDDDQFTMGVLLGNTSSNTWNLSFAELPEEDEIDAISSSINTISSNINTIVTRVTTLENAGYQTSAQVDARVTTLKNSHYQPVNTSTYSTLASFLASTGEEGWMYLYPVDTADLTKGYYQYIWENSAWIALSTTANINLSYYALNSDLTAHTGASNPHNITKTTVGLGNVPNVATNDQTPTYTEASSLTSLSSGETVTTAFGKISKAVSSLITHLSDSVKHITASERTTWNGKADTADIPTKTSDLTNDSGFLTAHQSLSAYRTASAQDTIDSGKVDKITGKGLSTNDYDATAKAKVDAIPNNPQYTDTVYDDTSLVDRIDAVEDRKGISLLWENDWSDSVYNISRTAWVDLYEYQFVDIYCAFSTSKPQLVKSFRVRVADFGDPSEKICAEILDLTNNLYALREFTVSSDNVSIGGGYYRGVSSGNAAPDNSYCVPIAIYGVDEDERGSISQPSASSGGNAVIISTTAPLNPANGDIWVDPSFTGTGDVTEYTSSSQFPVSGISNKVYIADDTNTLYRWDNNDSAYSAIGGITLGENSNTAYRGDRGKTAYDHSQAHGSGTVSATNPHGLTAADIGMAGALHLSSYDDVDEYGSFIGTESVNGDWSNLISVRHRNGTDDGPIYGMYIRSPLTYASDLIYRQHIGGTWGTERTIVDSSNISTYLLDKVYPVGSIYMSVNSTSPASLFGGTWVQLKDRFLLGAGDIYSNGATDGEATHTLSIDEMPSHSHGQKVTANPNYGTGYREDYNADGTNFGEYPQGVSTDATGGGQAHNNMPPYLAVYMWKRTV